MRAIAMVLLATMTIEPALLPLASSQALAAAPTSGGGSGSGEMVNVGDEDPCSDANDSDAEEQCNEKKLATITAVIQLIEGIVYTAAGIVCTIAAIYPSVCGACQVLTYVALGVDIAGGIGVMAAGISIMGKIDAMGLTTTATGALMTGVAASQSFKSGGGSGGGASAGGASSGGSSSGSGSSSCSALIAVMHFLQAVMRFVNAGMSFDMASKASHRARMLRSHSHLKVQRSTAQSGGSPNPGGGDMPAGVNGDSPVLRDVPPKERPAVARQVTSGGSATAQVRETVPKVFEEATGKPYDALQTMMLNGASPFQAAAAFAGDKMGPLGDLYSKLDANKDQLVKDLKGDLDSLSAGSKIANKGFETASTGGGRGGGDSGGGAPDLSALMAGLMPGGKKKEAGPPGAKAVDFGVKTAKANAEGLHAPEKSLFEIVGARYYNVQTRFLAGENVGAQAPAPSAPLPGNIYLRK